MTDMQSAIYEVETFLSENYHFRRNLLNGKVEACKLRMVEEVSSQTETPLDYEGNGTWEPVTPQVINSIVRRAKKEGIGGEKSPRQNIEEYIGSDAVECYDPIREYLDSLLEWDGKNHVAELFCSVACLESPASNSHGVPSGCALPWLIGSAWTCSMATSAYLFL